MNRRLEKRPITSEEPFHQRLDRHGRPFGDRLPPPVTRPQLLRNKLTPRHEGNKHEYGEPIQRHAQRRPSSSPPTRDMAPKSRCFSDRIGQCQNPNLQWRERRKRSPSPIASARANETNQLQTPLHILSGARPPPERNLEITDYPAQAQIPSAEQVMNELIEITHQYTDVDDPIERAARMQRVAHGEEYNLMATTAANIIAAATSNLVNQTSPEPRLDNQHLTEPRAIDIPESSNARNSQRNQGTRRVSASPRVFLGASSGRRLLSQAHAGPARHGFPHVSPIQQRRSVTTRSDTTHTQQGNPQDFPHDHYQLP